MNSPKNHTITIEKVSVFSVLRPFIIGFLIVGGVIAFLIYLTIQSGELQNKYLGPLQKAYQEFTQSSQKEPNNESLELPMPEDTAVQPSPTVTPSLILTPTPTIYIQKKPATQYYAEPTYAYPTIAPGSAGTSQWQEEFWKKWNEMTEKNAQMQKQVQESQKKFCEENAELCNK